METLMKLPAIGLKLQISPSLLKQMQRSTLSKRKRIINNARTDHHDGERLKASILGALMLQIGSWQVIYTFVESSRSCSFVNFLIVKSRDRVTYKCKDRSSLLLQLLIIHMVILCGNYFIKILFFFMVLQLVAKNEGDLVAKFYFAKRQLVWEILRNGLKQKIEIEWSNIIGIQAFLEEDKPGILEVEVTD